MTAGRLGGPTFMSVAMPVRPLTFPALLMCTVNNILGTKEGLAMNQMALSLFLRAQGSQKSPEENESLEHGVRDNPL